MSLTWQQQQSKQSVHQHDWTLEGTEGEYWYQCDCGATATWPEKQQAESCYECGRPALYWREAECITPTDRGDCVYTERQWLCRECYNNEPEAMCGNGDICEHPLCPEHGDD